MESWKWRGDKKNVVSWRFKFYNTTASLGQERREKTGLLNNLVKKYRYVRNETRSAQPEPSAHLTLSALRVISIKFLLVINYRKIPKISPFMYRPPKIVTQKTLRYIAPPNISPPGDLYLEFALEYKGKQSKNGKFPSHYKLAQSNLKRKFPSVHKPLRI